MNNDIFKRLLKKIEFEFEDGVVYGWFDNEYYLVGVCFSKENTHIDFDSNLDVPLTPEQEELILHEAHKIYKQHEDEYKQNLKEDRNFLGCNIIN